LLFFYDAIGSAAPALPSGFTNVTSGTHGVGSNGYRVAYKVAGGSEPASYTLTGGPGGTEWRVALLRITGVDTTTPINVSAVTSGTNFTYSFPTVTTTVADCLVVQFGGSTSSYDKASPNWSDAVPSGSTSVYSAPIGEATGMVFGVAQFNQASAGATGAKTVGSADHFGEGWLAISVAVAPAAGGTNGNASGANLTTTSSLTAGSASAAAAATTVNYGIVDTADDGTKPVPEVYEFDPFFAPFGLYYGLPHIGALRFRAVAVPQAATITSATLTLIEESGNSTDGTNCGSIKGADTDNCALWTTTDPSAVAKTTESVSITRGESLAFDVAAIVQAIVNRAGWASGNALGFIGDPTGATGSLGVFDYGFVPANAAQLSITYTSAGGTNGNASGASRTVTSSLTAGSASGVRNASAAGVVLTMVASLLIGTATGQRNATATGATYTATSSLTAGAASGVRSPTASGASLTATASMVAGSASGVRSPTASGETLTATASLTTGTASGVRSPTVSGVVLTSTASLATGAASGAATASGVTRTVASSLAAGAATGNASTAGASLTATASLTTGTATAQNGGDAVGAALTVSASLIDGTATGQRTASATGAAFTTTASLTGGTATATRFATVSGQTFTATASFIPGAASGGAIASGASLTATSSLTAGTASGDAPVSGGLIKVWTGPAWVLKPIKVWTGLAWIQKPLKRWTGSAWVST
jgi:hypothetical protein